VGGECALGAEVEVFSRGQENEREDLGTGEA